MSSSTTSLSQRRRKEIASLSQRKYRDQLGQFLIEGVRSVEAAVLAGAPVLDVLVGQSLAGDERLRAVLEKTDAALHVLPDPVVAALADTATPPGVLAVAEARLLPADNLASHRAVLALDAVQDPGNVGALIRSAAWFGADAVVAGAGTADLFNPKTVRAAMGGLWDVALARAADLPGLLRTLKGNHFVCYGADLSGTAAHDWEPRFPAVLILGSEAHGLSIPVRTEIDEAIRIGGGEKTRGVESLNVAVAAGILLHQWIGV